MWTCWTCPWLCDEAALATLTSQFEEARSKFQFIDGELLSKANGAKFHIGLFETPSLQELQAKYNHVLSHHGFKGKEATTTMDELKKTMNTDMAEIMVIDARAKTLQSLDKKE